YRGANIYRARDLRRKGNTGASIFLTYVSWPLFARLALGRLPGGYDAVFCFNTSPVLMSWPAVVYAKKHHIPCTNYVLDIWPENLYSVLPLQNRLLRRVAQAVSDALYRRADRLIAMSEPLQARLLARTGKQPCSIAVIPQYCEDFYATPTPDPALEARFGGRFNLVFTGNFSPAQSLETVIRAVKAARAQGAEQADLHLLLVGDGMSKNSLVTLVEELDATGYVTFYGSVPPTDIPHFTALAQALVVSLSDSPDLGLTVPAKLASYMAAGKPVVASMDGAGFAAVQQAACGFAAPACDVNALATALCTLCRMAPQERAALGEKAHSYYLAHYRRDELLRRLENFIVG
ncbi:MAG: glycosyltransferase family 4 protein, partial [Gemmiger sp.]|nr:glycosyltransferase family 4 protein [Gemmiger sp.]